MTGRDWSWNSPVSVFRGSSTNETEVWLMKKYALS